MFFPFSSLQSLKSTLDILGRPTDQLIAHFYSDVLKYQDEGIERERIVGELILSVGYLKEESVVEVNVIHGDKMGIISIANKSYQGRTYRAVYIQFAFVFYRQTH